MSNPFDASVQAREFNVNLPTIEDLMYIRMGRYVPVYSRPYVSNMHQEAVSTLIDRMNERKLKNVTSEVLSGISSSLISPSATPVHSEVNTAWVDQKRYLFVLKTSHVDTYNIKHVSYFQGYTSYDGITSNGSIDMNMEHRINSVIETVVHEINTPYGVEYKERLLRIYNVFTPREGDTSINMYCQRPYDIFYNLNTMEQNQILNNNATIYDTRYAMQSVYGSVFGSNVKNQIPTSYVSDVINIGINHKTSPDFDESFSNSNVFNLNSSSEPFINDNYFIKHLKLIYRGRDLSPMNTSVFNFHQLMTMDKTIYDRFKVFELTKTNIDVYASQSPEVGEYWHGRDTATITAYSVIEASVSLALRYGFTKLYFTATNMADPLATPYCIITSYQSYLKIDQDSMFKLLETFKSAFLNEVFRDETNNFALNYEFFVMVDVLGTTKVSIRQPGSPEVWYTIPTFANSLFSPVVTTNKNALDDLSYNIATLVDNMP